MAEYVPVYDTTLHQWKLVALTDIAGSMTAAQIVQVLQSAFGRLTWLLSGNSVDGQPDTATAAAIAAFISQTGVAADYVDWIDLGASAGGGTFVIADATSGSFADNVALVLSHGVLAIADAYSASFADNVTLVDPEALVFVIADAYSGSFSDVVTLARAGGELVIADAYSASFADNVVLEEGLAPPTTPVITATPGDTQVVIALTSGGTGATSYDIKWGTVAESRTNTIAGVTLPYTHTGRTNGTTYYYSLVAVNGSGSTESAEVSGTPVASGSGTLSIPFTGTDGQIPGTNVYTTELAAPVLQQVAGGTTATIQGNKYRVHAKASSSPSYVQLANKTGLAFSGTQSISAYFTMSNSHSGTYSAVDSMKLLVLNAADTTKYVMIEFFFEWYYDEGYASVGYINVGSGAGSGLTAANILDAISFPNNDKLRIEFINANQFKIWRTPNGGSETQLGGTYSVNAGYLGSNIKVMLEAKPNGTAFADFDFDTLEVQ
jgi:peptidoglycan hydrolase-like protein with peptidoglycan-binding domain